MIQVNESLLALTWVLKETECSKNDLFCFPTFLCLLFFCLDIFLSLVCRLSPWPKHARHATFVEELKAGGVSGHPKASGSEP